MKYPYRILILNQYTKIKSFQKKEGFKHLVNVATDYHYAASTLDPKTKLIGCAVDLRTMIFISVDRDNALCIVDDNSRTEGKCLTFSSFPIISLIVRIIHALLMFYSIRAQKATPS